MIQTLTDDELVKQSLSNADAFAVLYRRHLHRVYSYLLSKTSNEQDAQDLTTQTFLSALESLSTYEPRGTFGAWLIGIAKHKTADHFRKRKVTISIDDLHTIQDERRTLDDIVYDRMQIQVIDNLLEMINPERAEALRLRFFGQLKMREIGEIVERSEGAVKVLVSRGLEDIRAMLNTKEKTS